ncbi:MAG: SpoIIE family protein phosphatase [Clostridia bacterium]|nr:SpoIIE family protein phosphatase [Clostridia bacterium]
MKDVKALSAKRHTIDKSDILAAVIYHIFVALTGFILCRTVFGEKYMPFGIAFAAGCPAEYMASAAIGVFLGYFIPAISVSGFRYIAAALAVFAVRFMLLFSKRLVTNPLFAALLSALSLGITGAVSYSGIKTDVLFLFLEALVCAALSAVISRTSRFIGRLQRGLTGEELGCLLVVISMFLAGLYRVSVFSVSFSAVLSVALILCSLKYGGFLAGTVSSIAVSLLLFFAGRSPQFCFIYTVAALCSGLVLSYGKYIMLCSFFLCSVVLAVIQDISDFTAPFIAEILLGCILFALLPKNAGIVLGKIFTCYPQISVNNDLNKAVTLRLKEAAVGLKDVKVTVDEVAARLDSINTPSFQSVLDKTEDSACSGCKLKNICWEAKRADTVDSMFGIIKQIKIGGAVTEKTLPADFRARCLRPDSFCEAINSTYKKYSSAAAANSRIGQIRRAVTDQFDGISGMLSELSEEFSSGTNFDNAAALTAVTALKNIGIQATECSAPVDKYGRMTINMKLKKQNDTVLNKRDIMKVLSLSCEQDFDVPVIKKTSGETFINISERPKYKVDFGVCQKSAEQGDMCGDAYSGFSDGQGHFIILLSDGMGTGGRAAVDSAMASGLMSRLIKSGFGFDCALRILNSSMLFKSADESLATMDIASVDLFTGAVELYKAGAAPTLVRRSGRTGKATSTSMPVGILTEVSFDRAGIKLHTGDILVLLSDGAVFDGTDWIRAEIERFSLGSAQDLAERLCVCAESRRQDGHADDITVLTAIINKDI